MVEILGNNLKKFFDIIDNPPTDSEITYAGNKYEVWEVSDVLHKKMCNMPEEDFIKIAGEDAWWRSSTGSNLYSLETGDVIINNTRMIGWIRKPYDEYLTSHVHYPSLTEYLCLFIGASQPKNVCACAMDLAKINHMSMSELFEKYEGENYEIRN